MTKATAPQQSSPSKPIVVMGNMTNRPSLNTVNSLKGRSAELHVVAELTYAGFAAFTTENPHTKADILVEVNGNVRRIQVKSLMWRKDRNHYRAHPEEKWMDPYGDSVGYFVLYCRGEDEYFVVPSDVATSVYEVTWTPERLRNPGGRPRKVDLDEYRNKWSVLLSDDSDEWLWERATSMEDEQPCQE